MLIEELEHHMGKLMQGRADEKKSSQLVSWLSIWQCFLKRLIVMHTNYIVSFQSSIKAGRLTDSIPIQHCKLA